MLDVRFSYSPRQDAINILCGFRSLNEPALSELERAYLNSPFGRLTHSTALSFVREHVASNAIDTAAAVSRVATIWQPLQTQFVERVEKLFQCTYPRPLIRGYLTIDTKCSYSVERNCFYVHLNDPNPAPGIMQQLFQFYLLYAWNGLERHAPILRAHRRYDDLSEALTELLNVLFADLMNGAVDAGLPQHSELRALIRNLWDTHHSLQGLFNDPRLLELLNRKSS